MAYNNNIPAGGGTPPPYGYGAYGQPPVNGNRPMIGGQLPVYQAPMHKAAAIGYGQFSAPPQPTPAAQPYGARVEVRPALNHSQESTVTPTPVAYDPRDLTQKPQQAPTTPYIYGSGVPSVNRPPLGGQPTPAAQPYGARVEVRPVLNHDKVSTATPTPVAYDPRDLTQKPQQAPAAPYIYGSGVPSGNRPMLGGQPTPAAQPRPLLNSPTLGVAPGQVPTAHDPRSIPAPPNPYGKIH